MKKAQILRSWVRIKRKKHFVVIVWLTFVLSAVYQNCGAKKQGAATDTPDNGCTTCVSVQPDQLYSPTLAVDVPRFTFSAAVGSDARTFMITDTGMGQAMDLIATPTLSSAALMVTGNTCSGTNLSTNRQCSITIVYKNCTTVAQSGFVRIDYQDAAGTAHAPLFFYIYGPAGNPSALGCSPINPSTSPPVQAPAATL